MRDIIVRCLIVLVGAVLGFSVAFLLFVLLGILTGTIGICATAPPAWSAIYGALFPYVPFAGALAVPPLLLWWHRGRTRQCAAERAVAGQLSHRSVQPP